MEAQKVDSLILSWKNYLPRSKVLVIKEKLAITDDKLYNILASIKLKSSTTTLLLSIFLGGFGVDRFYIGDIGLGIAKLFINFFTFGIWALIDIFISHKKCKEKNLLEIKNYMLQ